MMMRSFPGKKKATKTLTLQLKDLNTKLDDTTRAIEDTREQGLVADKRVGLMTTEIEELRSALEQGNLFKHPQNQAVRYLF